jgi:lipopolysaccharide transport system ATP-binding protein
MTDTIISVENLSKSYLVGHKSGFQSRSNYTALRDVIGRKIRNIARKTIDVARGRQVLQGDEVEEFWALKNVSFQVKQGEVLGIIGRNGAGKSTLLKILSRITDPTEGRVLLRGRVASLLEVGTGFHPELTGRENIYLNGAILGMTRREITKKFDEIVAFAEVDRFLDTPVKRYSSGMYVRLAFAVAAHLEPEILVVDEVLAVGDIEFQRKCLGKMSEVASGGRTVLLVSHNMASIASLCSMAILLEDGLVGRAGPADEIIQFYSVRGAGTTRAEYTPRIDLPSITCVTVDDEALRRGDFAASIEFSSPFPLRPPVGGIIIHNVSGIPVWGSNTRFHPHGNSGIYTGSGKITCQSAGIPLAPAVYTVSAWLGDWYQDFDERHSILSFDFRPERADTLRPPPNMIGHLDWPATWNYQGLAEAKGRTAVRSNLADRSDRIVSG